MIPWGEWSASFDHRSLSEGSLTITATHSSASISDTTEIFKDMTPLVEGYVTISPLTPINRANMGSYSLNGTCFYNGQAITIHIKGQMGDPALPPTLSTCVDGEWVVKDLNLSDFSQGNVTVEVIHLDPSEKGYTAQGVVIKTSEGATVSINRNNLLDIIHGASNTYTLTGICTEIGEDVTLEVSDKETTLGPPSSHPSSVKILAP